MGTSDSPKGRVRCFIRKIWVQATPEELVRQRLLRMMTEQGGYPEGTLAVELGLAALPHLSQQQGLPQRRADILVFGPIGAVSGELRPLLLVECKAVPLRPSVMQQIVGYNRYVGAPFIALANQDFLRVGAYDPDTGDYRFVEGLIPYAQLLKSAKIDCRHTS